MKSKILLVQIAVLLSAASAFAVCGQPNSDGAYTCCEVGQDGSGNQCCKFDSNGEALSCSTKDDEPSKPTPIPKPEPPKPGEKSCKVFRGYTDCCTYHANGTQTCHRTYP